MELVEYDLKQVLTDFVDYLVPELKPHETAVYLFLLRKSYLGTGSSEVRVGQRTTAPQYGRGKNNSAPARNQLIKQLKSLEAKGCIRIGDTNREGTLYTVVLPQDIPLVAEKMNQPIEILADDDYFTDPEKRKIIFERDDWTCYYCGDKLTPENATLDHYHPQHLEGTHAKDNLRTSCLMCNSIKSGKTYEEAAPLLLRSIQERRVRRQNQERSQK
jgi:HNH endonuclease